MLSLFGSFPGKLIVKGHDPLLQCTLCERTLSACCVGDDVVVPCGLSCHHAELVHFPALARTSILVVRRSGSDGDGCALESPAAASDADLGAAELDLLTSDKSSGCLGSDRPAGSLIVLRIPLGSEASPFAVLGIKWWWRLCRSHASWSHLFRRTRNQVADRPGVKRRCAVDCLCRCSGSLCQA